MSYKHSCNIDNAPKFADWITSRGGVAVWKSVDLSNPGASWSSPAMDGCAVCGTDKGRLTCKCGGTAFVPHPKPTWRADDKPDIITDPADIEVYQATEVKRFRIGIRRGSQGLSLKVTDAGSRRIRAEVAKAGEGAYHEFDYDTQEAVIMKTTSLGSLKDWMEKNKGG